MEGLTCRLFNTRAYGKTDPYVHGMSQFELVKQRRITTHVLRGNLIRFVTFVPIFDIVREVNQLAFGIALILSLGHLWLAMVEQFRLECLETFHPDLATAVPSGRPEPLVVRSYFGPFNWESDELYQCLAADWASRQLEKYTRWATREEVDGYRIDRRSVVPTRTSLATVVRDGYRAEMTHFAGIIIDLPVLIGLAQAHSIIVAWIAFMIFVDFEMIVIQRRNRVRLRRLFNRKAS